MLAQRRIDITVAVFIDACNRHNIPIHFHEKFNFFGYLKNNRTDKINVGI